MLAREAELRSLRTQIDPHFLFNSLHSISALTTADPPAARRMCVLLGDFLRDSLALGAKDRITIARELQLADAVSRDRAGPIWRSAPDRCDRRRRDGTWLVPPLLLQPLVENAVTHGVAHVVEGGVIRISIANTGASLTISSRIRATPTGRGGPGPALGAVECPRTSRMRSTATGRGLRPRRPTASGGCELVLPADDAGASPACRTGIEPRMS